MNKTFVKVTSITDENGKKTPQSLVFHDEEYVIDKVLEVKNCASFKVGGIGERYKVRIGDNTTYLFYEKGKWFVEER